MKSVRLKHLVEHLEECLESMTAKGMEASPLARNIEMTLGAVREEAAPAPEFPNDPKERGSEMAWRCCNCNRVYVGPDPEGATECCQPEIEEVSEDDIVKCEECEGRGVLDETPIGDTECSNCLGMGVHVKADVYEPLPRDGIGLHTRKSN